MNVVGGSETKDGAVHAFLLWNYTQFIDLGALGTGKASCALAVNEQSWIVGWEDTGAGSKPSSTSSSRRFHVVVQQDLTVG